VAGLRLTALVVVGVVLAAGRADAQWVWYTGTLTGHIGVARGGDVGNATTIGGASLAVVDSKGLGAEIDIAHSGGFERDVLGDSSVTSFMVNFVSMYPRQGIRPFLNVGAGVLRVHTALPGEASVGRTEAAWNAGAGIAIDANDLLGFRADVRYFRLFDQPDNFVLRDEGIFDYWRTSIGVTLSWPIR
jgi:hypothetical protein